jgi:hypothetical protein
VADGERWKVTSQTPGIGLGPDQRPVEGWTIGFVHVPSGTRGTVFIPSDQYNANAVKAVILDLVTTIEAVAGLNG